jgi:hypothetical protein
MIVHATRRSAEREYAFKFIMRAANVRLSEKDIFEHFDYFEKRSNIGSPANIDRSVFFVVANITCHGETATISRRFGVVDRDDIDTADARYGIIVYRLLEPEDEELLNAWLMAHTRDLLSGRLHEPPAGKPAQTLHLLESYVLTLVVKMLRTIISVSCRILDRRNAVL